MTILHHIDFEVPDWGELPAGPQTRLGYANAVRADSPMGFWRLGEASGTVAQDASGNSLDGTYNGSVVLGASGPVPLDANTAVELDGSSAYVRTGLVASDIDSTFTFTCWFRSDDAGSIPANAIDQRLFTVPRVAGSSRFAFGLDDDRLAAAWSTGGPFLTLNGTTTIQADRWYHAAVTYDGAKTQMFLDGELEGSLNGALTSDSYDRLLLGIFWLGSADPRYFNGAIAEAAMFDSTLSQSAIAQQFRIGSGQ